MSSLHAVSADPAVWIVPVFGIAAATAIAFYTKYLEDLGLKVNPPKHACTDPPKEIDPKSCEIESCLQRVP